MKITKPGIYPGVSSADYFADPCPTPASLETFPYAGPTNSLPPRRREFAATL